MLPTGRITRAPDRLVDETVLAQRFEWETRHLLGHYQWIELAHLAEYLRMGVLAPELGGRIRRELLELTPERLAAEREAAMSDPLSALERCVHARVPDEGGAWHTDRSRNDVQATAQLMLGRQRLLDTAAAVRRLAGTAREAAAGHEGSVLPGYTQYQSAQAITWGFYLAALAEEATTAAESLYALVGSVNLCPLGAGALAGLELPWDRAALAAGLGFRGPQPHALTSVASRGWVLRSAAELAVLGPTLSRFLTDLICWTGPGYRFLDLPDELAGHSSVMPHKRNFPVLERARGMSGHLPGLAFDLIGGQRNTGYTNLVEVSKESTRYLEELFGTTSTLLALLDRITAALRFQPAPALRHVRQDLLAASTVAHRLTVAHGIPARTAQIVVGRWIAAAMERGEPGEAVTPDQLTAAGLVEQAGAAGFAPELGDTELSALLDAVAGIGGRRTSGSTEPGRVRELLAEVGHRLDTLDRTAGAWDRSLREARERTTGAASPPPASPPPASPRPDPAAAGRAS